MIYRPIKSIAQYKSYEMYLDRLLPIQDKSASEIESVSSLISLIKNWDFEHKSISLFIPVTSPEDPIERLISLMKKNKMKPSELATAIHISQTAFSDILNYKKELTKEMISRLSDKLGEPLVL